MNCAGRRPEGESGTRLGSNERGFADRLAGNASATWSVARQRMKVTM